MYFKRAKLPCIVPLLQLAQPPSSVVEQSGIEARSHDGHDFVVSRAAAVLVDLSLGIEARRVGLQENADHLVLRVLRQEVG